MMLALVLLGLFSLSCTVTVTCDEQHKEAYLITGLESSGAEHVARGVHYCVNNNYLDNKYDYDGILRSPVGYEVGKPITIYNQPVPYQHAEDFTWGAFQTMFKDYDMVYVIFITRYKRIALRSRAERFNATITEEQTIALDVTLRDIAKQAEHLFIWNYESSIILKNSYTRKLLKF